MRLTLPTRRRRTLRLLAVLGTLASYVGLAAAISARIREPAAPDSPRCETRAGEFYCGGERFLVKGIGWDATRPGKLPWKGEREISLVDSDFAAIRQAGFNTIRTWEALTVGELGVAEANGLKVLQGIWIDPAGDFMDDGFRKEQLRKVERVVRRSRSSSAVIAYLVMNEPDPSHVARIGVEASRRFLAEVAARIRELQPGALVSFSSWPGLEFFDVPELDFVAVNLYPFRPRVLMEAVGYAGMVALWKERVAGSRPLLVTEYGLSVAPGPSLPNEPGGTSESEQARVLPRLADAVLRGGGAGSATFMWIDGWWKNDDGPGDELTRDPADPEEWFGLRAMEQIDDDHGRDRPALAAMRRFNRAVLVAPADTALSPGVVDLEIHYEGRAPDLKVRAVTDVGEIAPVKTRRIGPWLTTRLQVPDTARDLEIVLESHGMELGRWLRRLREAKADRTLELEIEREGEQSQLVARVRDRLGAPVADASVRLALTEPSHRFDRFAIVETDENGFARLRVEIPDASVRAFAVAALRDTEAEVPAALASILLGGTETP